LWTTTEEGKRIWPQTEIDIIPGLMGFSLGGMAILLAFSNEKFISAIRQDGKIDSLFMKCVASFFHFLLIQTIALAFSIISISYDSNFISGLGFFFLSYGMLAAISIAGLLLQISRIFNVTETKK
tara:strand:- start:340 stop:714 length:375 start_codon:yes stop_codon:yes gene_type:complete